MESQLATQDVYMERPAKRARFTRGLKRVSKRGRKTQPIGFFKCLRWSSADATNNCHVQHNGNDLVPGVDATTVFSLSNVQSFNELVNLFDNFRITKVQYRWVCTRNPSEYSGGTAANKGVYPRIVWTHDFNDQTPLSRANIYQRANLKEEFLSETNHTTKWYTLNPSILTVMYESSTASAYKPTWKQWIDTSDNATPHYGIKYSISELFTGINVRLEAKVFCEFKGIS